MKTFSLSQDTMFHEKFYNDCVSKNCWYDISYTDTFNLLGFKTYRYIGGQEPHSLDEEEFTLFVLRYS